MHSVSPRPPFHARQKPRDAVRVRVVDELDGQAVAARVRQRVGHEHGAQRRAADADADHMRETRGRLRLDRARVHRRGEFPDGRQRILDLRRDFRSGRQPGSAQPVMAHHAVLIRIGDGAALQLVHGAVGLPHLRLHALAEARLEVHAAGVQGQTDRLHPAQVAAIVVPQFRRSHVCLHAILCPRDALFSTQVNRSAPAWMRRITLPAAGAVRESYRSCGAAAAADAIAHRLSRWRVAIPAAHRLH